MTSTDRPSPATPVPAADLERAYCACCAENECECQATDLVLDGPDALYVLCNCCAPVQCECEGTDIAVG